ncbi:MAG: Crp/Fnr family transcriptional regulator [Syntrophales bacterium]|jgi:CRP/FNR family transcriptional regulator|nr:Crp/Fnr family transcriptional regulator [Syntrophales bacterium]
MEIINQIAAVPLFEGLPVEQLQALARIMVAKLIKRGQVIFSEGDEAEGFYVIVSGRVKIFKLSPDGKEQILHISSVGEPFGEVPVFAGERFPAYAEAMEDSRTFFFPRPAFVNLIKKNPALALNMMALLARRLRLFTGMIESLSLREVPGRLAAHFLFLSDQKEGANELTLDISKNQLASLLGTIPETLSRILARMSNEGLIAIREARQIQILNRAGLKKLAEGEKRLS